jgi:predicted acetyltransferase
MNAKSEDPVAVRLTQGFAEHAALLQNLMQLYTHDFSEFWAGSDRGEVGPDGRFPPYPLEEYWSRPNWSALLIWSGDALAGLSLVNDQTHLDLPAHRNVGEFFILRKHRSRGVGRRAAEAVFALHPGWWEVAVTRKNLRAQSFWRNTLRGADRAKEVQEFDVQNEQWNGPIIRFEWRGA